MLRLGKLPVNQEETSTPDWQKYLMYAGIVFAFFGLVVLYAFEFQHFSRMLYPQRLVWSAIAVGAVLGLLIGYRFRHRGEDLTERIQIFVFCAVICMVFMPLFASLSNRLLAYRPVQNEQAELFRTEAFISRNFGLLEGESLEPTGYDVFFIYQNELYKVSVPELWFEKTKEGATIPLPLQQGFWGITFVQPQ